MKIPIFKGVKFSIEKGSLNLKNGDSGRYSTGIISLRYTGRNPSEHVAIGNNVKFDRYTTFLCDLLDLCKKTFAGENLKV